MELVLNYIIDNVTTTYNGTTYYKWFYHTVNYNTKANYESGTYLKEGSIQSALEKIPTGVEYTIGLLIDRSENITVGAGKVVVIDMDGMDIYNSSSETATIVNWGDLTIVGRNGDSDVYYNGECPSGNKCGAILNYDDLTLKDYLNVYVSSSSIINTRKTRRSLKI